MKIAILIMLLPAICYSQTIRVTPQHIVDVVPNINKPGMFFVERSANGTSDFVNNGIQYNGIRSIDIEWILNYSGVSSIQDVMMGLEANKSRFLYESQRCDKFIIMIFKMPFWLSSSTDTSHVYGNGNTDWRKYNAVPPANYAIWNLLMDSIVDKINNQWGLDPYYEIWNEPENLYWLGTIPEYFTFFKNTYFAIKTNHPTAKIGGPVTASFKSCFGFSLPVGTLENSQFDQTIIGTIIDSCVSWNATLDFISWHKFDPILHSIEQEIEYLNQKLISTGHGIVPYIISEWNQVYDFRDSPFSTAFMTNYVLALEEYGVSGQLVAAWQDFDNGTDEFHHDYGLLSTAALQKPAWKSLLLLNQLKGNIIALDGSEKTSLAAKASQNNDTVRVLISNYSLPGFTQAVAFILYTKRFTSADIYNAGIISNAELDSIFLGLINLPVTDSLSSAINQAIPIYTAANTFYFGGRIINLHFSGITGLHNGKIFMVDSTNNNVIYRYDSLINAGYTRSNAVVFLYPNTIISGNNICITDSIYTFNMQSNAVALIEFYGISQSNIHNIITPENNIKVYPNPLSSFTTLHSENYLQNASLTIYNSFGQIVKEMKNVSGQTITIYSNNIPSGLYLLRLTESSKVFSTCKLVVKDK